jgi:hypothetical protein
MPLSSMNAAVSNLSLTLKDPQGAAVRILVWDWHGLTAWGRTTDLDVAAHVVKQWHDGADEKTIARSGCVRGGTSDEAVAQQWDFLLRHGYDYVRPLASAVSEVSVLRRLRPWVGHGTLHLLPARTRRPKRPLNDDALTEKRSISRTWVPPDDLLETPERRSPVRAGRLPRSVSPIDPSSRRRSDHAVCPA